MNDTLSPVVYWRMSKLANQVAKQAMDNRGNNEILAVEEGEDILEVHGQAIRDYQEFSRLIRGAFLFLKKSGCPTSGTAIDMGSGTGAGAAILSKYHFFKKIYAVEFSEMFVQKIMPVVFNKLEADIPKIIRVVGDFNKLKVEDGTIDTILDIDSFHHAEDLDVTLQECSRVLRSQGVIIAVDRAWPDHFSKEELEAMLDRELPDNLKKKYGIPVSQSFTRRDFGEHEYPIHEWLDAFSRNGFDAHVFVQWHPPGLNRVWLRLPSFDFSIYLSSWLSRIGKRRHRIYGFHEKRVLFVCVKK
ncbi:MAG: class I SAM-dependent methyltransferase [Chloroflexota bacterium]|nr:class I SAM-dependent methyltransferase [Chloroflexota bacterium]